MLELLVVHADQPSSRVQIRLDRMLLTIPRKEVVQCLFVQPFARFSHK